MRLRGSALCSHHTQISWPTGFVLGYRNGGLQRSENKHRAASKPASPSHRVFAARRLSSLMRSEEHTSELQSLTNLVCRLLLEKKKTKQNCTIATFANTI